MKKGLFDSIFGKFKGTASEFREERKPGLEDSTENVGRWNVLIRYGKEKTPDETERIFQEIHERTDRCAVVLMDYNQKEQVKASENMSWIYDVNYSLLNTDNVCQVITVGKRCFDYRVRCLIAGVSEDKISVAPVAEQVKELVDLDTIDTLCFAAAPSTYIVVETIKEDVMAAMKEKENM